MKKNPLKMLLRDIVTAIAVRIAPTRWKEFNELSYWKHRKKSEGVLANQHYAYFYTTHFGLDEHFYQGKTIVDIGCGPRGSLEWASMAARRVGVDPLADEYLKLGASEHGMEYLCAPAESIPLADASCDVVFSFNSIDHVESVEQSLAEVARITRPGGYFLLIVEINHPPTGCEPHQLSAADIRRMLGDAFTCDTLQVFKPVGEGAYDSIQANVLMDDPETTQEEGYLSARFVRTAV